MTPSCVKDTFTALNQLGAYLSLKQALKKLNIFMFIDDEQLQQWARQPLSNFVRSKIENCISKGIKPSLLLFDLDGTIHAHGKIPGEGLVCVSYALRNSNGRITRHAVVRRYAAETLNRLASHESILVGFYTSCMDFTLEQVISKNGVFTNANFNSDIFFPYFSRSFNKRDPSPEAKPFDTVRDLHGVISAANLVCQVNGFTEQIFSCENVFLIDNELRKVEEFAGNYIIVPTFKTSHAVYSDDSILRTLGETIIHNIANDIPLSSIGEIEHIDSAHFNDSETEEF